MITDKMMLLASVIVNNLGGSNTVYGLTLEEQGGVMELTISTETAAKRYEWNYSTESFEFRRNYPIEA
ncbi:hypothetical protein [Ruminococcus sp.]|uniref:hypothetical protein n=1 Tax=Ruminococcus sp. TaxID=41978 RepID=UPI0025FA2181|nr:hypothetical protein [Ruminococcus sp.]MBQ8965880.1 hypothetical protein [Ruminococcus sp.]